MAPKDEAEAELLASKQRFESFLDDYKAGRWASATISLYFAFEHTAKTLLAATGITVSSHNGVTNQLSLHFVKNKTIDPSVNRYLSNLYERRTTAEYSPQRESEFTKKEVDAFFSWYEASCKELLPLLEKRYGINASAIQDLLDEYYSTTSGMTV